MLTEEQLKEAKKILRERKKKAGQPVLEKFFETNWSGQAVYRSGDDYDCDYFTVSEIWIKELWLTKSDASLSSRDLSNSIQKARLKATGLVDGMLSALRAEKLELELKLKTLLPVLAREEAKAEELLKKIQNLEVTNDV